MKSEYTYDYIHDSDIYIYQHKKMFRMNTDTALLAKFMKVKKGEKVLDIGTNNGALLAVANASQPDYLYGVDIQEEAIQLAHYNMKHHAIKNVELLCGDVCYIALPKVDVIVCNPPYFKVRTQSNVNTSTYLQLARHELYLPLEKLCERVSSLLDEKGRFYMVHRASRIAEIIYTLQSKRMQPHTLQFVYDREGDEAVSVLIDARKDGKVTCRVQPPIILKKE